MSSFQFAIVLSDVILYTVFTPSFGVEMQLRIGNGAPPPFVGICVKQLQELQGHRHLRIHPGSQMLRTVVSLAVKQTSGSFMCSSMTG